MTADPEVFPQDLGRYQLLPRLTHDEYATLRDDIESNGIRVPIDVDEHGEILDGHHRVRIAQEFGIECPLRVVTGLTDQQKRDHARSVNALRRSLTSAQRREQILAMRQEGQSIRAISTTLGVPKSTVADDLSQLSETGQLRGEPDRITGTDGKSRPAHVTETTKTEYNVDTETGEIVEQVQAAIDEHVSDTDYVLASWRKVFGKAVRQATSVLSFAVEDVAAKADASSLAELERAHRDLGNYLSRVKKATGLRPVGGRR